MEPVRTPRVTSLEWNDRRDVISRRPTSAGLVVEGFRVLWVAAYWTGTLTGVAARKPVAVAVTVTVPVLVLRFT